MGKAPQWRDWGAFLTDQRAESVYLKLELLEKAALGHQHQLTPTPMVQEVVVPLPGRVDTKEAVLGRDDFLTCLADGPPVRWIWHGPVHAPLAHRVYRAGSRPNPVQVSSPLGR